MGCDNLQTVLRVHIVFWVLVNVTCMVANAEDVTVTREKPYLFPVRAYERIHHEVEGEIKVFEVVGDGQSGSLKEVLHHRVTYLPYPCVLRFEGQGRVRIHQAEHRRAILRWERLRFELRHWVEHGGSRPYIPEHPRRAYVEAEWKALEDAVTKASPRNASNQKPLKEWQRREAEKMLGLLIPLNARYVNVAYHVAENNKDNEWKVGGSRWIEIVEHHDHEDNVPLFATFRCTVDGNPVWPEWTFRGETVRKFRFAVGPGQHTIKIVPQETRVRRYDVVSFHNVGWLREITTPGAFEPLEQVPLLRMREVEQSTLSAIPFGLDESEWKLWIDALHPGHVAKACLLLKPQGGSLLAACQRSMVQSIEQMPDARDVRLGYLEFTREYSVWKRLNQGAGRGESETYIRTGKNPSDWLEVGPGDWATTWSHAQIARWVILGEPGSVQELDIDGRTFSATQMSLKQEWLIAMPAGSHTLRWKGNAKAFVQCNTGWSISAESTSSTRYAKRIVLSPWVDEGAYSPLGENGLVKVRIRVPWFGVPESRTWIIQEEGADPISVRLYFREQDPSWMPADEQAQALSDEATFYVQGSHPFRLEQHGDGKAYVQVEQKAWKETWQVETRSKEPVLTETKETKGLFPLELAHTIPSEERGYWQQTLIRFAQADHKKEVGLMLLNKHAEGWIKDPSAPRALAYLKWFMQCWEDRHATWDPTELVHEWPTVFSASNQLMSLEAWKDIPEVQRIHARAQRKTRWQPWVTTPRQTFYLHQRARVKLTTQGEIHEAMLMPGEHGMGEVHPEFDPSHAFTLEAMVSEPAREQTPEAGRDFQFRTPRFNPWSTPVPKQQLEVGSEAPRMSRPAEWHHLLGVGASVARQDALDEDDKVLREHVEFHLSYEHALIKNAWWLTFIPKIRIRSDGQMLYGAEFNQFAKLAGFRGGINSRFWLQPSSTSDASVGVRLDAFVDRPIRVQRALVLPSLYLRLREAFNLEREALDGDIQNDYTRTHPWALQPKLLLMYEPWVDVQLRMGVSGTINPDLSFDRVEPSAGFQSYFTIWDQSTMVFLEYAPQVRFQDQERDETYVSHIVRAQMSFGFWFESLGHMTVDVRDAINTSEVLGTQHALTLGIHFRWLDGVSATEVSPMDYKFDDLWVRRDDE